MRKRSAIFYGKVDTAYRRTGRTAPLQFRFSSADDGFVRSYTLPFRHVVQSKLVVGVRVIGALALWGFRAALGQRPLSTQRVL